MFSSSHTSLPQTLLGSKFPTESLTVIPQFALLTIFPSLLLLSNWMEKMMGFSGESKQQLRHLHS